MAQFVNPTTVWQPFGSFSMAALPGDGQMVLLKGQVALDPDGQVVGRGDMRAQLSQVLANIEAVLASLGGGLADIVSLNQYATDIEAFMQAGDIRAEKFKPPYPVTTTLEVSRLYHPDLMIEITAVAEIPRDRYRQPKG
ncbi:MAG: RidA family protein [Kiloniellales bacterium]|nr:RidA family protein [Kiloniellales bacterium]